MMQVMQPTLHLNYTTALALVSAEICSTVAKPHTPRARAHTHTHTHHAGKVGSCRAADIDEFPGHRDEWPGHVTPK